MAGIDLHGNSSVRVFSNSAPEPGRFRGRVAGKEQPVMSILQMSILQIDTVEAQNYSPS